MNEKRKAAIVLVFLLLALIVVTVGMSGGCASTALPPRLSNEQLILIDATRFPASVGVERYQFPVYSDDFLQQLRATHLFKEVDHLESMRTPPDLIARIERPIHGEAVIPLVTALSLGIIPTMGEEEHGYSFSFSTAPDSPRIPIEFSYKGMSTLGWWAVIMNALPNYTMGDVKTHVRFQNALAWAIVSKRDVLFKRLRGAT